jgi:hypothetical protein
MIIVRGRKVYFTGKDAVRMRKGAASLGLSEKAAFTGMLWERVMQLARQGAFKKAKKTGK